MITNISRDEVWICSVLTKLNNKYWIVFLNGASSCAKNLFHVENNYSKMCFEDLNKKWNFKHSKHVTKFFDF